MQNSDDQFEKVRAVRTFRRTGIPLSVRQAVLKRDGYRCQSCGKLLPAAVAHIHHIRPIAEAGGDTAIENLQTLCPTCHRMVHVGAAPISGRLAFGWINAFKKAPRLTATASLIVVTLVFTAVWILPFYNDRQQEAERLKNNTYAVQIEKLKDAEQKLRELTTFISEQQSALQKTENSLQSLKMERDTLAPLVASQRDAVSAIFAVQEKRAEQNQRVDRWIGYAFGVITSIVASAIWAIGTYFWNRNRSPS